MKLIDHLTAIHAQYGHRGHGQTPATVAAAAAAADTPGDLPHLPSVGIDGLGKDQTIKAYEVNESVARTQRSSSVD